MSRSYITGCIEAFSANVALPPDLLPEQQYCRFHSIYRTIATCVLSPELVNAYAHTPPSSTCCHVISRFVSCRHLAIEASLRAHRHARQHYELWAQRECVAVDSCAAYLASLALTERLLQLRLQYDTCVPSISHFARTLRERAVSAHKLSCAVERWGATGMLHGRDKEVYSLIYSGNLKRITISASPPRVMAFCLMSVGGSRRDKSLLRCLHLCVRCRVSDAVIRNLPPFAALDSDVFNSSIWPIIRHNRQFFPKGSHIMSEGSMATGVWLITHGCATRCIAAASDSSRQKQLVAETLVPGQSAGWEELALLMRPEFSRQVFPPSAYKLFRILADAAGAGTRHQHVQRHRLERCAHHFYSRKRNQGRVLQPGVFICSSSICTARSRRFRSHVSCGCVFVLLIL